MLARIELDENKGILFCIKILSSYNRHLKNLKPSGGLVSLSSTPSYMRPSWLILDPSQI